MLVVPVSLRPTFSNRSREGWELRTFTDLVVLGSSMLTMISCGAARALRTWLAAATLAATAFLPVAVKADTSAFPPPVVVVYPFTVSGTMDPEAGGNIAVMPMMGGSVPIYLFADLFGVPVIGLPIVNHDNNQHAANENLRLQNLWDGIRQYGAMMSALRW